MSRNSLLFAVLLSLTGCGSDASPSCPEEPCAKMGDCTPLFRASGDTWVCRPASDADCQQSWVCHSHGRCSYDAENHWCRAMSLADCTYAEVCQPNGCKRTNGWDCFP